jgi:hypothetical protein
MISKNVIKILNVVKVGSGFSAIYRNEQRQDLKLIHDDKKFTYLWHSAVKRICEYRQ